MDPATEKHFGLSYGGALGKDIRELAPDSDFHLAIAEGTSVSVRQRIIRGARRLAGVYPLKKKNGEIIGAIGRISFNSLEEIELVHKKLEELRKEVRTLRLKEKDDYSSAYRFDNILGTSQLIRDTIATAKRIAVLDTDVLIEGESGTGKELFAHSIHSYRCNNKPFVKINCPAIPFELAESQLFGYEKGAYTGATASGRPGVFETAKGGIVFLDEISSLPLSIQAKLLRVLQEREIQRLGSSKAIRVDFRFIAATNVNLFKLSEEGKFRYDLYYRIAKASLRIPSLRERIEDISFYLENFLESINKSFRTQLRGYSSEAMSELIKYPWPGNVRQLMHVLEQIAVNAWDVKEISIRHLPKEIVSDKALSRDDTVPDAIERNAILSVLKETKGNRRRAAMILHMPRSTFYKKLERYNITRDELST